MGQTRAVWVDCWRPRCSVPSWECAPPAVPSSFGDDSVPLAAGSPRRTLSVSVGFKWQVPPWAAHQSRLEPTPRETGARAPPPGVGIHAMGVGAGRLF